MFQKSQNFALSLLCATFLIFNVSAACASEHEGEAKKDGPIYVDFKSIVVPVIKKNGSTGVIALNVMAEVKDDEAKTKVADRLPKLRDAFIRALYGNLDNDRYTRQNGSLDIDNIKTRLMKTAAYVMRDDKNNPIQDILFQNISQQTY